MTLTLATALAFARHGHAVFPVTWPVERGGENCSAPAAATAAAGHALAPRSTPTAELQQMVCSPP